SMSNESGIELNGARVVWEDREISFGILIKGGSATILGAGLPKSIASNTATVKFIERSSRVPHEIPIDVSPLRRLAPGNYEVNFRILSLTEAKLEIALKSD